MNKTVLFILAILITVICFGQSHSDYIEIGNAKFNREDYRGAIEDYSKAIRLKPDYAIALYYRGLAKYMLEDYKGAIADFTKAIIEIENEEAVIYGYRGLAKAMLEDYYSAIADFTKAIEIEPEVAVIYGYRGEVKFMLNDYKGAIADFTRAIEIEPGNALSYNLRGTAKFKLGDYKSAIVDYDKAIGIEPEYAMAYANRGKAKNAIKKMSGCPDLYKADELGDNSLSKELRREEFHCFRHIEATIILVGTLGASFWFMSREEKIEAVEKHLDKVIDEINNKALLCETSSYTEQAYDTTFELMREILTNQFDKRSPGNSFFLMMLNDENEGTLTCEKVVDEFFQRSIGEVPSESRLNKLRTTLCSSKGNYVRLNECMENFHNLHRETTIRYGNQDEGIDESINLIQNYNYYIRSMEER